MAYKFRLFYPTPNDSLACRVCDDFENALRTKKLLMEGFGLGEDQIMIFSDQDRFDTYLIQDPIRGYFKNMMTFNGSPRMGFTPVIEHAHRFTTVDAAKAALECYEGQVKPDIVRYDPHSHRATDIIKI